MKNLLKELQQELIDTPYHYDFYDNSKTKQQMIDLEKRQIERLIKTVKILSIKPK